MIIIIIISPTRLLLLCLAWPAVPLNQRPMLIMVMVDIEDTTVLTIMDVDGMERDRLKMRPLPQDQIPMLTPRLMAGVSYFIDKVGFNQ